MHLPFLAHEFPIELTIISFAGICVYGPVQEIHVVTSRKQGFDSYVQKQSFLASKDQFVVL